MLMLGLIPKNPKLTVDRSAQGKALRYCIDADTEKTMQRQRLFMVGASGATIYIAAFKLTGSWWWRSLLIAGSGVTLYTNAAAYATVRKAGQL